MLMIILKTFLYALVAYIGVAFLAAGMAAIQEKKIWKDLRPLTLFGMFKVFALNTFWMVGCLFGSMGVVVYHTLTLGFLKEDSSERIQYLAHCVVERYVATWLVALCVGKVKIEGIENLPSENPGSPAPVYIANHASQIDTAVVYYLNRRFRWISKSSVLYLPGVGQIMWLSGHVFIDRFSPKSKSASKDDSKKPGVKTTARNLYIQSNKSIQDGVPMFFFPQGTRRMLEQLPFKDGAFKVAIPNGSALVPISINIPLDAWTSKHPFGPSEPVVLTVHKPIPTTPESDMEKVKAECFKTIYSALPDYRTKKE